VPKWLETALALLGASSIMSCIIWFLTRPKLSIELDVDLEGGPPATLGCFLTNQPITQKLAVSIGIQRKDAVVTFLSFRISDVDLVENNEIAWVTVAAGQSPAVITCSHQSQYFPIVTIHPDDGRVRVVREGLQLPPLEEGKYLAVVQVEMEGRLQHRSRFFHVTTWAPFAFWVGPTSRAGPKIPNFHE
jgi:hypothetical protein